MGSDKRKVLKTAYKDKSIAGGIYCIECGGNHHRWIKSTRNLESQKNRFEFAVSTRSCRNRPCSRSGPNMGWNRFPL